MAVVLDAIGISIGRDCLQSEARRLMAVRRTCAVNLPKRMETFPVDRKSFAKLVAAGCGAGRLFRSHNVIGTTRRRRPAAGQCACAAQATASARKPHPQGIPTTPIGSTHDKQLLVDFGGLGALQGGRCDTGSARSGRGSRGLHGRLITAGWKLDESFPGKPYINRGISGQTTPQMLVRFRQDVIDLKPKVVVIFGGTNDIAGNTGPMTIEETEGNIASMADLAKANGIRVVLCSVLPALDYWWAPGPRSRAQDRAF